MRISPLRLFALLILGVLWLGGTAAAQTQEAVLTASDGEGNDRFGRSVALSADGATALVGGHQDEIGGMNPPNGQDFPEGSAYIFTRDASGTWTEQAKLTASDATGGDAFGWAAALNADGTGALVGANGDEFSRGSAYVFIRMSDGSWAEQAKLTASDGADFDSFGASVALNADGSVALIGATNAAIEDEQVGSAYVFSSDEGGNWTEQAKLTGSDLTGEGFGGEKFGQAVALNNDGTTALVGANEDPINGNDEQGSTFVFTSDGVGNWTEQAKLTASDGMAEDQFGWSVSLNADGSVALVGRLDELADADQGSAYIFTRDESETWTEEARLAPPSGAEDDRFGFSVSLNDDGTVALVSARETGGSAYVFSRDGGGNWSQTANFVPTDSQDDDSFGQSVSIDSEGERTLVGAPRHDVDGETDQGSAYVFSLPFGAAPPTVTTEPATNITETSAQLNGTVNPNSAETTVDFVYYPTGQPGLGQTIAADQSPLTGTTEQDVSATATSLQADTEYTFLVSAENSEGLTNGAEVTFTTGGGTDPVTIAVTETIGVSDEAAVTPPVTISITESVTVSDAPQVTPPATIAITETIGVSDAPGVSPVIAISTSTVESSGEVDFGGTGISIDFAGVGGSGEVTVTKFGDPPDGTDGISLPSVSQYRYTIKTKGALSVGPGTEVRFDVGTLAGLDDPEETTIFKRPTAGTGTFSALPTTFDATNNLLIATTESLSEFALASDEGRSPVELTRFDAEADGETVHLTWRTASETQNAGFGIERSRGETGAWTHVGFVEGHGTTSEPQDYHFIDSDLPYEANRLSYRLKQVDLDGGFEYSPTVEVALRIPDELALRGNFPNPFAEQTTIHYALPQSGPVRLTIYDVLGRRVATLVDDHQDAGRHEATFAPRDLASGTYLVRLFSAGATRTQKMTVVR